MKQTLSKTQMNLLVIHGNRRQPSKPNSISCAFEQSFLVSNVSSTMRILTETFHSRNPSSMAALKHICVY